MTLPNKQTVEVSINFVVNAHRAAIIVRGPGPIHLEIRAHRDTLKELMQTGLDRFTRTSYAHAITKQKQLPSELADPETAWPWLVKEFPWIFDGIDTSKEPYAHYLSNSYKPKTALQSDLQKVSHLGQDCSLADLSEIIYGRRYYSGSQHKYLKQLREALISSSSHSEEDVSDASSAEKRAA